MKKLSKLLLITIFIGGLFSQAKADEGMWLPFLVSRLNYTDMQKEGVKLTAEEIYSVNHSSLKDAVIQFGNGCTGEIVSDQGLIFTNHHCGYEKIQEHSTVDHDYLTDGFWAYKKEDELSNPGFTVKFLERIEDVTKKVLTDVTPSMTEEQRSAKINEVIKTLQKENSDNDKYEVVIKPFFNGNEYYMFVMQTYKDVRLVGAPPSSIGKYGGDTDNWMWPRHTGDFSIFRVYTAPDGSPAEYSKDNIPMKPKHYLPISLDGVKKNDFTMIMGYPGSTNRYLTSFGVEQNLKLVYPTRIKIRRAKLDIYEEGMASDPNVRIQYSSKHAGVANYWKNFIGMSKGLKNLNVADKKRETESQLTEWINQNNDRKEKYGTAISDLKSAYSILDSTTVSKYYFIESIYNGPEVIKESMPYKALLQELSSATPDKDKIAKIVSYLKTSTEPFFKDYNKPTDQKLWAKMMEMYHQDVPLNQQPKYLLDMVKKYKGDYNKWAKATYGKTIFASPEKLAAFLNNPSKKVLEKDPVYIAMQSFYQEYSTLKIQAETASDKLEKGNRLFMQALREMQTDKNFYPDANFTMRLTYGTVQDYYPADAVHYEYFTTMKGIMQKEDPTNPEFIVAPKLKKIYETKDFGQYADGDTMKVCFLTNNDITGGNSGSPVINAKGHLIGLAFDGNWEAMSGDIAFEPELQRTICVDIRYVLLIIDKYAGAKNLIDEMTLVK